MLGEVEFAEGLVDDDDGVAEGPAGGGEDDPVVHEAGVGEASGGEAVIERFEVNGGHDRGEGAAETDAAVEVLADEVREDGGRGVAAEGKSVA